jgi:predicted amidohydrolase YtcJ
MNTTGAVPGHAGLREAHAHIPMLGVALRTLDVSGCASREECLERLRARASELAREDPGGRRWLAARGARVNAWREPRWITRDELDAIAGDRPAFVMSFDHHALAAGSAAFRAAGIGDADPDPAGGVIERDGRGKPTGLLLESAAWKVRAAEPQPEGEERERVVLEALDHLHALGFGEVHDLLSPAWLGPVLAGLADTGRLRQRVWLYPALEEFDAVLASAPEWEDGHHVTLAGAKVFADGTLNARTAWMLEPYADPMPEHPRGMALLSAGDLRRAIERMRAAGVGLAVHAIGDGAVRAVLDAWEGSRPAGERHQGWLLAGARPRAEAGMSRDVGQGVPALRIEHCELVHPADVARFADLGVVCSVQPCHLLYDVEVLRAQLGDRLDRVLPLRRLVDAGCRPGELLWFGSDAPIVRANPGDSVVAATVRRRTGDTPGGAACEPIAPGEGVSEAEAWNAFGRGSVSGG